VKLSKFFIDHVVAWFVLIVPALIVSVITFFVERMSTSWFICLLSLLSLSLLASWGLYRKIVLERGEEQRERELERQRQIRELLEVFIERGELCTAGQHFMDWSEELKWTLQVLMPSEVETFQKMLGDDGPPFKIRLRCCLSWLRATILNNSFDVSNQSENLKSPRSNSSEMGAAE
jgi:hypothetical protein